MKLTPLDIRKQTFRHKTMRGYDPEEVRIFLDMTADEYEQLLQENGMLSEKIRYLGERLEEYHNLEKTLQASILTAERAAADSRERSRIEAQTIINDAHVRSERILDDARSRLRLLSEQLQQLSAEKDLFLQRFQALLEAHAKFLASQQGDLDVIDALDARARSLISNTSGRAEPRFSDEEETAGPFATAGSFAGEEESAETEPMAESSPRMMPAFDEDDRVHESPADPPQRRFQEALPPRRAARAPLSRVPAEDQEPADTFYPAERREGFFELNARSRPGGSKQQ